MRVEGPFARYCKELKKWGWICHVVTGWGARQCMVVGHYRYVSAEKAEQGGERWLLKLGLNHFRKF